ncbi:hypothetical protein JI435_413170 [Parastagonospora nodorum SN15]|uniref:Uncharacterized protein n=1 Tax=Phaeosphaeria nodorum (strain SN15 / ATCC MYA-4574 / FGSC 10173) TaxID=321614 RepID=A0A7U2I4M1_PHANO|nr:hypothetical protein JI435_413170 [Parastagonospora nodorum SN15]
MYSECMQFLYNTDFPTIPMETLSHSATLGLRISLSNILIGCMDRYRVMFAVHTSVL